MKPMHCQYFLRISSPELVKDIPGVDMGKMILHIDERSRDEAKKLTGLIDFKRSMNAGIRLPVDRQPNLVAVDALIRIVDEVLANS